MFVVVVVVVVVPTQDWKCNCVRVVDVVVVVVDVVDVVDDVVNVGVDPPVDPFGTPFSKETSHNGNGGGISCAVCQWVK